MIFDKDKDVLKSFFMYFDSVIYDLCEDFASLENIENRVHHIPVVYDKPVINRNVSIDQLDSEKKALLDIVMSRYPYVDNTIALNNLKNLKIEVFNINDLRDYAHYDMDKNRICLYNCEDTDTLFHELCHAFSYIYDNGINYCGFSQSDSKFKNENFIALDEAYVSLMEKRRINDDDFYSERYRRILLIENIIGRENLAKYFFTANTRAVIDDMDKYIPENMFLYYLRLLDFLYILDSKFLINKRKRNNMKKDFENEATGFEAYIKESYEDINHKKLVLNIK
ncbi:MAG: hypothetical protein IJB83_06420 [Bacilli bacterium]|nr:hypothetical protein [Bacilli bacterium]